MENPDFCSSLSLLNKAGSIIVAKENPIKRIFDLYTSDLSFEEIQKLIKRESTEVYEFFAADLPKSDTTKNKFMRALIFARNLFNAFLLKLS